MKDSGIPWIGEIPKDWEIAKVKHHFYRKKGKALLEEPIVLSLARSGVKVRDISNNEGQVAESYYEYNPVAIDDLLLNPMDLYSGANCSLSKVEGVISPAYVNLRYLGNTYAKYYDYYFKTQYWGMALFAHGKGISFDNRWTLGNETLMNYYIPSPSLSEQKTIAEFLDRKCGEIDELVALQDKMIEELKAYKQSIITETVTKGLNPNVPLKDSGIEWIGEIPHHWSIKPLKFLIDYNTDSWREDTYDYTEIRYVEIGDVSESKGIENSSIYFFKDAPSRARRKTKINDIIISTVRTYLKAIAKISEENITVSTGFMVIRARNIVPQFLFYALREDSFINKIIAYSNGISYPAINASEIANMQIQIPPLSEQQEIANFLDKKCSEIDSLIELKQQKIEELKDYKKSIIYEYVTGKKQVEINEI